LIINFVFALLPVSATADKFPTGKLWLFLKFNAPGESDVAAIMAAATYRSKHCAMAGEK